MRLSPSRPLLVCVALIQLALSPLAQAAPEPKTQVIVIEDDGARIEELRVRGEARSIQVQPKGTGPKAAYEIQPARASRDTSQRGLDGQRVWKLLSF